MIIQLYVKSKDNVEVVNIDGTYTSHIINEILYVPQLKKNLLLIGCISGKDMRVIFEDNKQNINFYKNN